MVPLLATLSFFVVCASASDLAEPVTNKDVFVTMLYTIHGDMYVDGFEIGVRVLGQSLRESKTSHDYVVLCTDDVPDKVKRMLEEDGWIVKSLQKLEIGDRFNENAFKLNVWQLTEYRRIVFIDADAIVVQNIDELFKCGSFCAAFRHSDLFNSGVMVIEPSISELQELTKQMEVMDGQWVHRTYGDQIVLNHYFKDLKKAVMFHPGTNEYHKTPMRLSSGYNGDVAIYYLTSRWMFPKEELKIIHYTMGIVKPMIWWTYPLFHLNWEWDALRGRLPSRFNEPSMFAFKHWLPAIVLVMLFISFRVCDSSYKWFYKHKLIIKVSVLLLPGGCSWCMTLFPFVIQLLLYSFAFYNIPTTMRPMEAWCLFFLLTMFYMVMFYGLYCHFLLEAGESFGPRSIPAQAAKFETVMHTLFFCVGFWLRFIIPYLIGNFVIRSVVVVCLELLFLVQGYVSGRRVLRVWFGHSTTTITVLPMHYSQGGTANDGPRDMSNVSDLLALMGISSGNDRRMKPLTSQLKLNALNQKDAKSGIQSTTAANCMEKMGDAEISQLRSAREIAKVIIKPVKETVSAGRVVISWSRRFARLLSRLLLSRLYYRTNYSPSVN